MPQILIVEPSWAGHRFAYTRFVAQNSPHPVVLLTSSGAREHKEFTIHLADIALEVVEVFNSTSPGVPALAREIANYCRGANISVVLVLDADALLPTWWRVARRPLRDLPRRPVVSFLYTRYPPRLYRDALREWPYRAAKAFYTALAMLTGTLTRAAAVACHDDTSRGLLVARARDPAVATSHSSDRAAIRTRFELPANRRLVGVYGAVSSGKLVPLVLEAVLRCGPDVDLLLAGTLDQYVEEWLDALPTQHRDRVIFRSGPLSEQDLDALVAASDVVSAVLAYTRPSAIMGKALAAGVPVVSANSSVRAQELRTTRAGASAELEPGSIAEAIMKLIDRFDGKPAISAVSIPTALEMTEVLLGMSDRKPPVLHRATR